MRISYFTGSIKQTKPSAELGIVEFIKGIKEGKWQDEVLQYRAKPTKENKAKCSYVTVSGTFDVRNAK